MENRLGVLIQQYFLKQGHACTVVMAVQSGFTPQHDSRGCCIPFAMKGAETSKPVRNRRALQYKIAHINQSINQSINHTASPLTMHRCWLRGARSCETSAIPQTFGTPLETWSARQRAHGMHTALRSHDTLLHAATVPSCQLHTRGLRMGKD
jgi:hypothetical protein